MAPADAYAGVLLRGVLVGTQQAPPLTVVRVPRRHRHPGWTAYPGDLAGHQAWLYGRPVQTVTCRGELPVAMQQMTKTRQRAKRAEDEVALSVPTSSLSDTEDTAELVEAIDALLKEV